MEALNKIVEKFDQSWVIKVRNNSGIIRRKNRSKFIRFFERISGKKWNVKDLYRWIQYHVSNRLMHATNPIEGDGVPVKGFPSKFRLSNGWSIPKEDLKSLFGAVLVSENRMDILVKPYTIWERIKRFAPIVAILAGILTIILRILELIRFNF